MTRSLCITFSLLLGLTSCDVLLDLKLPDSPPEPETEYALRTTEELYQASIEDSVALVLIEAVYTNLSDAPVYFVGCYPPQASIVERWEDDTWQPVYFPPIPLCVSPSIRVAPGDATSLEEYVDSSLGASPCYLETGDPNCKPSFIDILQEGGTYRLRQEIYWDEDGNDPLPDSLRVSNPFEITL